MFDLGQIKARITGDNSQFKKSLDDSKGALSSFANNFKSIIGPLAAGFGFTAIVGQLRKSITEFTQLSDELGDLEAITGMSANEIQRWQYVSKMAGVEANTFTNAVSMLTRRLSGLEGATGDMGKTLESIGVSLYNAGGEMRNMGDVTAEIIEQLSKMENVGQRNALAADIFGRSFQDVAVIIGEGSQAIEEWRIEAEKAGIIIGDEMLAKFEELRKQQITLNAVWRMTKAELVTALIPALEKLLDITNRLLSLRGSWNFGKSYRENVKSGFDEILSQINIGNSLNNLANASLASIDQFVKKAEEVAKKIKEQAAQQAKLNEKIRESIILEKTLADLLSDQKLKESFEAGADKIGTYNAEVKKLSTSMAELDGKTTFSNMSAGLAQASEEAGILTSVYAGLGEILGTLLTDAGNVWQKMLGFIASILRRFGELAIAAGAAALGIKEALATLDGWVAIGAGIALVAASAAVASYSASFAEGGVVYGPTLAMVGDNPGAAHNPEIIAPLDKLGDYMNGGGNMTFTIKGDDLITVMGRANKRQGFIR